MLIVNWKITSGGVKNVAKRKNKKYTIFLNFLIINKLVLNKSKKTKNKTVIWYTKLQKEKTDL